MRRLAAALVLALASFLLATGAEADPSEYAIVSAGATASSNQAGAHPDFTLEFELARDPKGVLPSTTRDLLFDLPPGLLANPTAVSQCTAAQLATTDIASPSNKTGCPQASQVGIAHVEIQAGRQVLSPIFEPIFNMEPRQGVPASLGFIAQFIPVVIDAELQPARNYAATVKVEGPSSLAAIASATNTVWGVPADESNDAQRITPYEALHTNGSPDTPNGKRPAGSSPTPYMINPTRCDVPQGVEFTAIPYALPSLQAKFFAPLLPNTGCSLLEFKPEMSIAPTTTEAESGSGLDVELSFPTEGLEHPNLLAEAALKRAEVALPEGLSINPSRAAGLGVCSEEEFERETATSAPNEGCPETAKIGSALATSPLSEEPAEGSLFIAKPHDNPFDSLIAVYLALKIPDKGVIVKLAGKVTPDPRTGQLITTFDQIPQLPVSSFKLHFRDGARSPLVTPPRCGTYEATARFTSWAGQDISIHPGFQVSSGPNGGPCPQGAPPFEPGFTAGTVSNDAGAFSPSHLRFTRRDGDQELTRFSVTLPPGLVAKLAGVSQCPNLAIQAARAKTGLEELASPSCPAKSEIGHILAGGGVGQLLTYVPGKLYLAGPYNGDPLSAVAIVPAVTGPFDVGTVITRVALTVDPESGEVQVDGSRSDPVPHILAGIPLKVRDVSAFADRPEFTINPTNCDPLSFRARLQGGGADPFSSADDSVVSRVARFQASNCALLGFKPGLSLQLSGGTRRGAFPALRTVLRARKGDANLDSAQLTLPRSVFIEQGHFRTVCTRVQFAAEQCPPGAVYGKVRVFSPLLDEPLEGPAYLRSSSHELPDLVFALHGIVDIDVVGRIDSVKGRLRASFETLPDAPFSKAVVLTQGAGKSLIVNSTDLCQNKHRAKAKFGGQNGKTHALHPQVKADCGGKSHKRPRSKTR